MEMSRELNNVIRQWVEVFMHHSGRDFKRFMENTGLSFSQINILMRLFHGGCAQIGEVGEKMGITKAAASQAVDRLVQMGLVQRQEDPQDRRIKRLELTPHGRDLIQKGLEARTQWLENLAQSLPLDQQQTVLVALTLLTEAARQIKD